VGLDFDADELRGHGGTVAAVAAACLLLPLLCGAGSALFLHPRFGLAGVPFPALALFLGVATAVTAFPMLARLLVDRGMDQTTLGRVAIGAAAIDDGIAWCLFAVAVGILEAAPGRAAVSVLSALGFAAALLFVARPLVAHWLRNAGEKPTQGLLALIFAGMLGCVVVAEVVGVNSVFGAFLWGFVIPRQSGLARQLVIRLRDVVTALLLPAFFAYSGLRTDLTLAFDPAAIGWAALVIVLATAGKLGGGYWASRACGLPRRDALVVGALMNTRALMELIALNIGLQIGAISRTVFAMFVLMAIATTMMTGPIVDWALRPATRRAAG
jgi:Kef-type K+ transport system membrane component KefB